MSNFKNLKKGSILSESSFFIVEKVSKNDITVVDESGNTITIGKPYVENILDSADYYEKEEKVTATALADILLNNPRIAMSVCYVKRMKIKLKKLIIKKLLMLLKKFKKLKYLKLKES